MLSAEAQSHDVEAQLNCFGFCKSKWPRNVNFNCTLIELNFLTLLSNCSLIHSVSGICLLSNLFVSELAVLNWTKDTLHCDYPVVARSRNKEISCKQFFQYFLRAAVLFKDLIQSYVCNLCGHCQVALQMGSNIPRIIHRSNKR